MLEKAIPVQARHHKPAGLLQWMLGLLAILSVFGSLGLAAQFPDSVSPFVFASGFVSAVVLYALSVAIDCLRAIRYHTAILAEVALAEHASAASPAKGDSAGVLAEAAPAPQQSPALNDPPGMAARRQKP